MTKSPKLGLALSGGVAWGFAHIGVLEILEKEGIRPDIVVGTSMGAIVGSLWLMGKPSQEIAQEAAALSRERLRLLRPRVSRHSILSGSALLAKAKKTYSNMNFSDLPQRFACVATDIYSGQEVVLKSGPLWPAILASSCIPVAFEPVKLQSRYLVDGGLSNSVPVSVAKHLGADRTIAVNVQSRKKTTKVSDKPTWLNAAINMVTIGSRRLVESETKGASILIEPNTSEFAAVDFQKYESLIQAGRKSARELLPELRRLYSRLQ